MERREHYLNVHMNDPECWRRAMGSNESLQALAKASGEAYRQAAKIGHETYKVLGEDYKVRVGTATYVVSSLLVPPVQLVFGYLPFSEAFFWEMRHKERAELLNGGIAANGEEAKERRKMIACFAATIKEHGSMNR